MKRRRYHDPLGVSDCPNVVTDPDRLAVVAAEVRRRVAWLEQQYQSQVRFGLGPREFNSALAALRRLVDRPTVAGAMKRRLHPILELCITHKAKQLAGLSAGANLSAEHAEFVGEAARRVAAEVKAIRGTPGNPALRRYVEGLVVVMQEATGRPVMAPREKDTFYDPHLSGEGGKAIRILVDRLEPRITDSKLSYWIREARKRHAGKPMRFRDLFPAYGMTVGSDGMPRGSTTFQIERFEMSAPIYCR